MKTSLQFKLQRVKDKNDQTHTNIYIFLTSHLRTEEQEEILFQSIVYQNERATSICLL